MINTYAIKLKLSSTIIALAGVLGITLTSAQGLKIDEPADNLSQRVKACTVCHGKEGRATNSGYFPRIAGKPADYLYQQLLNFREGRRSYAPMSQLVEFLSDDYLYEIARHFAGLNLPYPPPQAATANASVLARGQALVEQGDPSRQIPACRTCHGAALTGVLPQVPGLLGLPRDYLTAQLGAWRNGQRRASPPDCMRQIARRLDADDVNALSQWLSSRPLPAHTGPAPQGRLDPMRDCGLSLAKGSNS